MEKIKEIWIEKFRDRFMPYEITPSYDDDKVLYPEPEKFICELIDDLYMIHGIEFKICDSCLKPIHIHPHDFYDNDYDCNCSLTHLSSPEDNKTPKSNGVDNKE